MTKNFDSICQKILGETVTAPAQPNQPGQTTNQSNQPGQTTKPATPAATPPAATPAAPNPELTKAFETLTKHAANNQDHVKAIAALQQLLTAQQNAANKPK